MLLKSMSEDRGIVKVTLDRISLLDFSSGGPTKSIRSNRPGLNNDVSKRSGLLVIPITITPQLDESSISDRIWDSTRSFPEMSSVVLGLPRESISSNTTTQGDDERAFLNISLIA